MNLPLFKRKVIREYSGYFHSIVGKKYMNMYKDLGITSNIISRIIVGWQGCARPG